MMYCASVAEAVPKSILELSGLEVHLLNKTMSEFLSDYAFDNFLTQHTMPP
jgi:hypothetical protein